MSIWSRLERRISNLADEFVPAEARDQLELARKHFERDSHALARRELLALTTARPELVQAWIWLARASLASSPTELPDGAALAEAEANHAVTLRAESVPALLALGAAQLALVRPDDAQATLARALARADGNREALAECYRGLGLAWLMRGELAKALRELRKAVAEAPADDLARAGLALALACSELPTEAAYGQIPPELQARYAPHTEAEPLALPDLTGPAARTRALLHLALGMARHRDVATRAAEWCFAQAARDAPHVQGALAHWLATHAALGLARCALQRGALEQAATALAELTPPEGPLGHDLWRLRAELAGKLGQYASAVEAHAAVLASANHATPSERLALTRHALDAAIAASDQATMLAWSQAVLAESPDDVRGLTARGLTELARGNQAAALGLLWHTAAQGDVDGLVELAAAQQGDAPDTALQLTLEALELVPTHARALQLIDQLGLRRHPGPADGLNLRQLTEALEQRLIAHPVTADLARGLARAAAALDEPLLVTVMGEFSSGKSSFINALVGADVAPTGITPTTATINVLKYAHERGGRLVKPDESTVELAWEPLFARLRALSPREAASLDHVEILVPEPSLERINIVDTPGLNSILPEHEATARAYIRNADAVVWIFSAQQAGKASERAAIAEIAQAGKRVLGVLNKADQLTPREVTEVLAYVQQTIGQAPPEPPGDEPTPTASDASGPRGLVAVVPFSARDALAWKLGQGQADGNWPALFQTLEQAFFSQARALKQAACHRRVQATLGHALARLDGEQAGLRQAEQALTTLAHKLQLDHGAGRNQRVAAERKLANEAHAGLMLRVASEVLALVMPRKLPFTTHTATPADVEYLSATLVDGYAELAHDLQARAEANLAHALRPIIAEAHHASAVVGDDVATSLRQALDEGKRKVRASGYDQPMAYARGYVRGAMVEPFFKADLPHMQLGQDAVYHALMRRGLEVEAELVQPTLAALDAAIAMAVERLLIYASRIAARLRVLDSGMQRALQEYVTALVQHAPTPPAA